MGLFERIASNVMLMVRRPPRQQYGALCHRIGPEGKLEIMLVTSRETGRWVIPKGWPMGDKPSHEVAAQEAYEEAGVRGRVQQQPLGHFIYQKRLRNGLDVETRVQVYTLEVSALEDDFPECKERNRVFLRPREAAELVKEPGLKRMIRSFGNLAPEEPTITRRDL